MRKMELLPTQDSKAGYTPVEVQAQVDISCYCVSGSDRNVILYFCNYMYISIIYDTIPSLV